MKNIALTYNRISKMHQDVNTRPTEGLMEASRKRSLGGQLDALSALRRGAKEAPKRPRERPWRPEAEEGADS